MSEPVTIPLRSAATEQPPVPAVATVSAADGSPLADLRSRRAKLIEALWVDLEVPRWADDGGPSIWVRYKPIGPGFVTATVEKRFKAKGTLGKDWLDYAHADVLIEACVGVFAKDGDATYSLRPADPDGEWTKFDPDLAASLGLDTKMAVDVVRALYLTSADLKTAVDQLIDWSGQESARADKDAQGN